MHRVINASSLFIKVIFIILHVQILQSILAQNTTDSTQSRMREEDIKHVADRAHGFVAADLAALCKEG